MADYLRPRGGCATGEEGQGGGEAELGVGEGASAGLGEDGDLRRDHAAGEGVTGGDEDGGLGGGVDEAVGDDRVDDLGHHDTEDHAADGDAALGEALGEHLASAMEADAQGVGLAVELARHVLAREAAVVVEDQRHAVFWRERVELLLHDAAEFFPAGGGGRVAVCAGATVAISAGVGQARFPRFAMDGLAIFAALARAVDVEREAARDLLKPWADRVNGRAGFGLDGEGEERGLDGVFGVVAIAGDLEAEIKDHAPVAADDFLEGFLTAGGSELSE